jgi:hypothetical protein
MYTLEESGSFLIRDFNNAPAFSSFLPGIAGRFGIPLWCFYVNRGQAVTSFGTRDKDHAILEFEAANKAYACTFEHGFRTFIRMKNGFYEPFTLGAESVAAQMHIRSASLELEEANERIGLRFRVRYCTLPDRDFAALVRDVEITNVSKEPIEFDLADGLPQITPYGMNNWVLKHMSRTIEAWIDTGIRQDVATYRLRVDPADVAETIFIKGGHFYFGLIQSNGRQSRLQPVVDPAVLYKEDTGYAFPHRFADQGFKYPKQQVMTGKTPSAFGYAAIALQPGETVRLCSFIGSVEDESRLHAFASRVKIADVDAMFVENERIVDDIIDNALVASGKPVFDRYIGQNYLDNVLRGGYPADFDGHGVAYLYSRKHGDIERDYNQFFLSDTWLSSGNGNYRDVNQNRRCDVFFNPEVRRDNIYLFYNLQRADGYNPLVVKPATYLFSDRDAFVNSMHGLLAPQEIDCLWSRVKGEMPLGEFVMHALNCGVDKSKLEEFAGRVLSNAACVESADFGEGFWVDHWTYNLDLVEAYYAVYPDRAADLFFENVYSFYDDAHYVNPRSVRYYLRDGKVYQGNFLECNKKKDAGIAARSSLSRRLRYKNGHDIVYTNLVVKMMVLVCTRLSTLDPAGRGIEMEAGKPGWCDALNGLPALLGSSLAETFELKRLCRFLVERLVDFEDKTVELPLELHEFYSKLYQLLKSKVAAFEFWQESNTLKETYREQVFKGFSEQTALVSVADIRTFCQEAIRRIDKGIKFLEKRDDVPTFFINEVVEYVQEEDGAVKPVKFCQRELPLFLEGFVRAYKTMEPEDVRRIHGQVRKSSLYDKATKMFKLNASLDAESMEIGRARVFKPGWLENESIWLHMEYKYLLELIKSGCYDEFYRELEQTFVCFLDPAMYGRSTLENSSFIVSSAYVDKQVWGRGFVARLSGSTIEALHAFLLMSLGPQPFRIGDDGLSLTFAPALKGDFFSSADNTFAFRLFGKTQVVYHNPSRRDTYSEKARIGSVAVTWNNGEQVTFDGNSVPEPACLRIRDRQAVRIDVYFDK